MRRAALALIVLGAAACDGRDVTFSGDVAPIVYERCAACHRPAGSAPFSLLDYADVRKRAKQIAQVTGSRFMPPWLPEPGHGAFLGERRLTEDEVETLAAWYRQGAPEGDPASLPAPPRFETGWTLGEPDLVVEMPETYTLPADGVDVYRNFVLPVPLDTTRYVRAVDFRPGNPQVVHHARMLVDHEGSARRADRREPQPGFGGMIPGGARNPDGMLLGWTPGKPPFAGASGMAWRLEPGTDVVLQLHMLPSGKPETIRPTLALYLADAPPTKHPFVLLLGTRSIDIPAGATDYAVEDGYVLPVDVDALAIYPHAHYLGKRMEVHAELPDGERRSLLRIEDWDFNWQDEYHYREPVALPRGSRVVMRYVYDNSAENVRNPNDPPRRVAYGARSSDEMAELLLQLLPRTSEDRLILKQDYDRYKIGKAIAFREEMVRRYPTDPRHPAALGASYLALERYADALPHLERALELDPDNAQAHNNAGYALGKLGRHAEALPHYRSALAIDPDRVASLHELAWLLATYPELRGAEAGEATRHAERAAELTERANPFVLRTLAVALAAEERNTRAIAAAEEGLALARRQGEIDLASEIERRFPALARNP